MIDLDALLQPISDSAPAGEDISFSHEFDVIQEARRSDDASLDQGEWVTELKSADWPTVAKQCNQLLQKRSKDLRLAAWLAEAASHQNGFAGLASGYRLMAGLCDNFWDSIHPEMEDGDIDLRVGNLSWMLSQSIQWMRSIPLTQTPEAKYTAVDVDAAARGGQAGGPDMAAIDKARAATSFSFYQQLAADVPEAQEALRELERVIDDKLGNEGPSFSGTRDALEKVSSSALRLAAAAGAVSAPASADTTDTDAQESTATTTASESAPMTTPGVLNNRRDALLQLQQVADFFRRTEPHSPVTYLAERAAKWGSMPLHVWLKAVLKEEGAALGRLEELLGVANEDGDYS